MNYFTATLSPRYRIIITSRLNTYLTLTTLVLGARKDRATPDIYTRRGRYL